MKRWAIGLLAILLVVVVAIALWVRLGVHVPEPSFPGSPPPLLAQIPPSAQYIAYTDVAGLRASPFLTQLAALFPPPDQDPEYAAFVRETGFDYSRDLDRVVVAFWPTNPPRVLALADGRFDRERIASYALRSGKLARAGEREIYSLPPSGNAPAIEFTFLSASRIAMAQGGADLLPAPGAAAPLDPAMYNHVRGVAGSAIFAVGRLGDLPQNLALGGWQSNQLDSLLRSIRWLTLAGQPQGDRLKVALEAECDSTMDARKLSGTLEGLRLIGRMALADPKTRQQLTPQAAALLGELLGSAELSRTDRRVDLRLDLTERMLRAVARPAPGTAGKR
jgi:hypothetical protein